MTATTNEIQRAAAAPATFNFFDLEQFKTMQRVCTMFANSELVPDMYRATKDNPIEKATANCMIAVELSQRIGASPLMVMQNLVIIYGKPSWSSKFLIATVNSCGRFEPLQYRFTDLGTITNVEYTEFQKGQGAVTKKVPGPIQNFQCVAYTKKRGGAEVLESIPVTIEMAIKEGWYTKNGSKWKTMEKLMLTYRAASFWTSAYAPELSMGIKTTEEVIDIQDIPHEEVIEDKIKTEANKEPLVFDKKPEPAEKEEPADKKPDTVAGFEAEGKNKAQQPGKATTGAAGVQTKIDPSFAQD